MNNYDVLVIGSGAAGLGLALSLANNTRIAIICKDQLKTGSSQYAQGGIAAVLDATDSIASHKADTMVAGDGLCDPKIVDFTVTHARDAVHWLATMGVPFTVDANQRLHLTQEGGHSHRRVCHVADKTGAAVIETLTEKVTNHPNIDCFIQHIAIDLIVANNHCIGATFLDINNNTIKSFHAKNTVLATGGASYAYKNTSNPDHTTGDGIAMSWRAGCRIANMEFNQFHPTCLAHPQANYFLITEVVRGEGGFLCLPSGERFMQKYDSRGELAPRDIVSRAIFHEMQKNQCNHVYLDITARSSSFIKTSFPNIYSHCLKLGLDMTQEPLPVAPAAHYTCGGVITNQQGQTDLKNLYAIGEVAYTGLHGANRMASNSLLECLVFAASAAKAIQDMLPLQESITIPSKKVTIAIQQNWDEKNIDLIRDMMWKHVGIVRNTAGLKHAAGVLHKISSTISDGRINEKSIEYYHLITVAKLMVRSALDRHESRGTHYNTDFPSKLDDPKPSILKPTGHNGRIKIL